VKRREFITLLGGAAAWPLAAQAQPMPVIGYFGARTSASDKHLVDAFRSGLKENGYVEGQNVAIEFRWAEGRFERVADFVADFNRRQVAVIFAGGGDYEVKAVKAAIGVVPMVFAIGGDPVEYGFVASFNRRQRHGRDGDYRFTLAQAAGAVARAGTRHNRDRTDRGPDASERCLPRQ
jgi:putative ABC transport system substrate-binding protein